MDEYKAHTHTHEKPNGGCVRNIYFMVLSLPFTENFILFKVLFAFVFGWEFNGIFICFPPEKGKTG